MILSCSTGRSRSLNSVNIRILFDYSISLKMLIISTLWWRRVRGLICIHIWKNGTFHCLKSEPRKFHTKLPRRFITCKSLVLRIGTWNLRICWCQMTQILLKLRSVTLGSLNLSVPRKPQPILSARSPTLHLKCYSLSHTANKSTCGRLESSLSSCFVGFCHSTMKTITKFAVNQFTTRLISTIPLGRASATPPSTLSARCLLKTLPSATPSSKCLTISGSRSTALSIIEVAHGALTASRLTLWQIPIHQSLIRRLKLSRHVYTEFASCVFRWVNI